MTGLPSCASRAPRRHASCRAATLTGSSAARPGNSQSLGRANRQCAQNLQQLSGEHDVALLAALAALDPDQHAGAVDRGDLQASDLADSQTGPVRRRQRRPIAQSRDGFKKAHNLVAAENGGKRLRLAASDNPLDGFAPAQRDPKKEPERARHLS